MVSYVNDFTGILSEYSWSSPATPTVLTYSFETSVDPDVADAIGNAGAATLRQLNPTEIGDMRNALSQWDRASGLTFLEVPSGQGDLRFHLVSFTQVPGYEGFAGFAYYPNKDFAGTGTNTYAYDSEIGGDIFLNTDENSGLTLDVILHEVGHALGLKHPFEGEIQVASGSDNGQNTILSYNRTFGLSSLGTFDLQAAASIYGPDRFVASLNGGIQAFSTDAAAFSTRQVWGDAASKIKGTSLHDSIWGGAGADSIAGFAGNDFLYGGIAADVLLGGDGHDRLYGETGTDVLNAGAGSDLAGFSGFSRQATINWQTASGNGTVRQSGETDTFFAVEQLSFLDGLYVTGTAAQVARLYDTVFSRDADLGGLTGWTIALESGTALGTVAAGFTASAEFQQTYGLLGNGAFVTLLYANVLDRAPDQAGLNSWLAALNGGTSRADVVVSFSESQEHINAMASQRIAGAVWVGESTAEIVTRFYYAALERAPDAGGLTNWIVAVSGGTTLAAVAQGFAASLEFQNRYGSLDNGLFVERMYDNVLNRPSDSAGYADWNARLGAGATRGDVLLGFAQSAEFQDTTAPYVDDGVLLV